MSSVADLVRPALLRVDLREGVAPFEISSAGPPLLFERFDRLRCAVPSPLTPAVAAPTARSMLCALAFFGFAWLLLTCCSARYRSALVAMPSRIAAWLGECTRCLAQPLGARNRCKKQHTADDDAIDDARQALRSLVRGTRATPSCSLLDSSLMISL